MMEAGRDAKTLERVPSARGDHHDIDVMTRRIGGKDAPLAPIRLDSGSRQKPVQRGDAPGERPLARDRVRPGRAMIADAVMGEVMRNRKEEPHAATLLKPCSITLRMRVGNGSSPKRSTGHQ